MSLDARAKIIVEAVTRQAVAEMRKLDQEAKKSSSGMDSFKQKLGKVTAAFGTLTAAGLAAKKIFDFAQEGAEITRLSEAGDQLARSYGLSMDQVVGALREASLGAISNTDLILGANRALTLGVADSTEEFTALMQVATQRGRAMGLSTEQAFSDIVTGVGRLSPMILDNLGIVLDADATYGAYAEQLGITSSELTDLQKRQALMNRLMQEAGPIAEDTATAYERFGAQSANAWDRFKQGIGEALEPFIAGQADAMEGAAAFGDALETLGITGLEVLTIQMRMTRAEVIELADAVEEARGGLSSSVSKMREMAGASHGMAEAFDEAAGAGLGLSQVNIGLAGSIEKALEQLAFMEAGGAQLQDAYGRLMDEIDAGTTPIDEAGERLNYLGQRAIIAAYDAGQASYDEAIAGLEEFGLEAAEALALLEALAQNRTFNVKGNITMTGGVGGGVQGNNAVSKFARGGDMSGVGVALVGERGPELIINQRHVIDAKTTRALLGAGLPVGSQNMFGFIDPGDEPAPIKPPETIVTKPPSTKTDTISTKTPISTDGGTTTIITDGGGSSEAIETAQETATAVGGLASTIPSVISAQSAAQAQQAAETRRQNNEIIARLEELIDISERQGTANDIGSAVQSAVSMVAG